MGLSLCLGMACGQRLSLVASGVLALGGAALLPDLGQGRLCSLESYRSWASTMY